LGTLYICATPIGNLSDISSRLIETLNHVDYIYGEDTRRVLKLLNHLKIEKPVHSYFVGNEHEKMDEIENLLDSGKNVALLSDAGTPLIADPGSKLVSSLSNRNVKIESIPGPSSVIVALTLSGFDLTSFRFIGFIPKSGKERSKFLSDLGTSEMTTVCFTSPKRLVKDLEAFAGEKILNKVVICRELTKKFETIYRGTSEELLQEFRDKDIKGEITLVIEGTEKQKRLDIDVESAVQNLLKYDIPKREIAKTISLITDVSTNEIYKKIKDF
jgi:16S rRNA (cytidine1402-2'-O)-methyltransferase